MPDTLPKLFRGATMKFFRYGPTGAERPALLDANGIGRDLSSLIDDFSGAHLHPDRLRQLAEVDASRLPEVPDDARIGAVVPRVGNFIGIGLNFADHAAESGMEAPSEPILFNKAPSSIAGPNDVLELPAEAQKADWEVELAVVIGAPAYRITREEALAHVAGFTICNDISERAFQIERLGTWSKGKGLPGFGPLGPYLVTPDEVPDPQALKMWLTLNGETMQNGSTATMIFPVDELVSYCAQFMALEPGDVITTGTPPGVGMGMKPQCYLQAGDVMELGIEGLGTQRQVCIARAD